jgi:hypothetical protein
VLGSHLSFQAEILEASLGKPFLSFVLQIDPAVVRRVSADMLERHTTTFRRVEEAPGERSSFVSALDRQLLDSVLRFLTATGSGRHEARSLPRTPALRV